MKNKYYRFFYKNIYWFIGSLIIIVPWAVMYSIELRVKKLDKGVEKDLQRIEKSGRKFSEIPKTF